MELRVLKYFIAIANAGGLSKAALGLHITQPTLSRQLQDLEAEIGVKLFRRNGRKMELTDSGVNFYQKAIKIITLSEQALIDISQDIPVRGDIYIGCGEAEAIRPIAIAIAKMQKTYPNIIYHFLSGNAEAVRAWLEAGTASFGIFIQPANMQGLDFIDLKHTVQWGVLMRKNDPLALLKEINPANLEGRSVIASSQQLVNNELAGWLKQSAEKIHIAATYTLLFNASLLVRENIGVALCIDGIANTADESPLCFRPLRPALHSGIAMGWKSGLVLSKPALLLRNFIEQEINSTPLASQPQR